MRARERPQSAIFCRLTAQWGHSRRPVVGSLRGRPGCHFSDGRRAGCGKPLAAARKLLVGLTITPKPGWHGYWSNAGDSGLPPSVRLSTPPSLHVGALGHPAPTLLRVMGLTIYVHSGAHVLTARMTVDRRIAAGTPLPVTADVRFAVCPKCPDDGQRQTLKLAARTKGAMHSRIRDHARIQLRFSADAGCASLPLSTT